VLSEELEPLLFRLLDRTLEIHTLIAEQLSEPPGPDRPGDATKAWRPLTKLPPKLHHARHFLLRSALTSRTLPLMSLHLLRA
jgi:hypothetical protein